MSRKTVSSRGSQRRFAERAVACTHTCWAVAFINLLGAAVAQAHVGEIAYPVFELAPSRLPDLHDGTLADWEAPYPSLTQDDFLHDFGDRGPEAFGFSLFLAWTAAPPRLYLGLERMEEGFAPEGDYLSIAIDGDHSGGQFTPDGSQAQSYVLQPLFEEGGYGLAGFTERRFWAHDPPYADVGVAGWGDGPHQWVVELAVTPWDLLVAEDPEASRATVLAGGRILGFHLAVIDIDDERVAGSYRLPAAGPPHGGDASRFADAELIPCHLPGCSRSGTGSAVHGDSWGRIKASFEPTGGHPWK